MLPNWLILGKMEKHTYVTDVLFDGDENEVEADISVYNCRSKILPQPSAHCNNKSVEVNQLIKKQHETEQRTLDAAARSLSILKETEDIGIHAAKVLELQGEKLHHTIKMLDEMKTDLKQSQKHINGIQSFFYEVKNFFTDNKDKKVTRKASPNIADPSISKVCDTIDTSLIKTTPETNVFYPETNLHGLQTSAKCISNSQQVDDILECNLNEMAQHLTQLKGLSLEFGKQINHQNELIDAITDKVENAEVKIVKQNKQMKNLLENS